MTQMATDAADKCGGTSLSDHDSASLVNLRLRPNGRVGAGCGREWVPGGVPGNTDDADGHK
jgi:hypothetical protein